MPESYIQILRHQPGIFQRPAEIPDFEELNPLLPRDLLRLLEQGMRNGWTVGEYPPIRRLGSRNQHAAENPAADKKQRQDAGDGARLILAGEVQRPVVE
ncbi:MAG: hypothetical protein EHM80_14625 [Nitrospiraceae bacterium]|nr:MAG: hypothetical protein EHM80_14625 [Nitrospiraceae bacterium]